MADPETIAAYERDAERWMAARHAESIEDVAWVAANRVREPVADLGCGPGWHLETLAGPRGRAVGLDATAAMADLAAARPGSGAVLQGDVLRLPFAAGSLGGAIVSRVYPHLPAAEHPMALAELHLALAPGAPVFVHLFAGDRDRPVRAGGEFSGRLFARHSVAQVADLFTGAGFGELDLQVDDDNVRVRARRAATLADTVGPNMRLLICGLNPSIYSAEIGVGFGRPGNRFWPAALDAGLLQADRDPFAALRHSGVGMTDLVKRATARASELDRQEYVDGLARVERMVAWLQPSAVCFVGLAGWRSAVAPKAISGWQTEPFGGRPVYLMPSTSGLNASSQHADFVAHLIAAATSRPT